MILTYIKSTGHEVPKLKVLPLTPLLTNNTKISPGVYKIPLTDLQIPSDTFPVLYFIFNYEQNGNLFGEQKKLFWEQIFPDYKYSTEYLVIDFGKELTDVDTILLQYII